MKKFDHFDVAELAQRVVKVNYAQMKSDCMFFVRGFFFFVFFFLFFVVFVLFFFLFFVVVFFCARIGLFLFPLPFGIRDWLQLVALPGLLFILLFY